MDYFLKTLSCLFLIALIAVQFLLMTPYRAELTNDELNGRVLKPYETLIYKGSISLDALGNYQPNSADIFINGIKRMTVDSFPVNLHVCDGDVVEIKLKHGSLPFYIYPVSQKGEIKTDLQTSTVKVISGICRIFKVLHAK